MKKKFMRWALGTVLVLGSAFAYVSHSEAANCRTECEVVMVIGPNGIPTPQVVCRLKCDL